MLFELIEAMPSYKTHGDCSNFCYKRAGGPEEVKEGTWPAVWMKDSKMGGEGSTRSDGITG